MGVLKDRFLKRQRVRLSLNEKVKSIEDKVTSETQRLRRGVVKAIENRTNRKLSEFVRAVPLPKDGLTPRKGEDYFTPTDIDNLVSQVLAKLVSSLKPTTIRDLLQSLYGHERLDASAIKNLPTRTETKSKTRLGGRGTSAPVKYYDLTSSCDGSTTSFTIPANERVVGVFGSQFPQNLRPDVDWTLSGSGNITLTLNVDPPETGQTLYIIYVEA